MDEEKKEAQKKRLAYREKEKEQFALRVIELTKVTLKKFSWATYIATDFDGVIYAFGETPDKREDFWAVDYGRHYSEVTPVQALILCGRVPQWSDYKPTPVNF